MELAKALALLMALIAMAGRAPVHIHLQLWRMLEASIEERQSRSSFLNEYFVPKIRKAQKAGVVRDDIPAGLAMLTFGGVMLFRLHNRLELDHAVSLDSDHLWTMMNFLPILSASLQQLAKPVKSRCKKPENPVALFTGNDVVTRLVSTGNGISTKPVSEVTCLSFGQAEPPKNHVVLLKPAIGISGVPAIKMANCR